MILLIVRVWRWTKDQYRRLSARRRVVILVSVIPPVLLQFLGVYLSLAEILIAYVLWGLVVAPILASAMNHDSATTERFVDNRVNHLSDKVSELREDHKRAKAELQQEVVDLEGFIRASLAERDIVLPPRPRTVGGLSFNIGTLDFKVGNVRVTRGSWRSRFLSWIRSARRRTWEIIYGRHDDR